jgi:hypothetical protein
VRSNLPQQWSSKLRIDKGGRQVATKWLRKVAAACLVCASVQGVPFGQKAAPGFEETVAWIQSKFGLLGGAYATSQDLTTFTSYDSFSMDQCTLRFRAIIKKVSVRDRDDPVKAYRTAVLTHEVDLTKISDVQTAGNEVILVSPNQTIKIHKESAWKDGSPVEGMPDGDYMTAQTNLDFLNSTVDNADLVPRFQKALQNAVSICKARGPRKSEPF